MRFSTKSVSFSSLLSKKSFPFYAIIFSLFFSQYSSAQKLSQKKINIAAEEKFPTAIFDLMSFLKLQNDGHFENEIEQNFSWCDSVFSNLKFERRVIKTEGAPLLLAEKKVNKNLKTILFYLQIDGQPVDSSKWNQQNPFLPVLKEKDDDKNWKIIDSQLLQKEYNPDWRIFARSASDSKGPAMSLISALQILQAKKINPAFNIKVIMDFQEEMGSPSLPKAVIANRQLLNADMLFIMDGTRHLSNLPTLTFGARGIATATLKVFGPRYHLHSGQYGNFAPNPVFETSRLLSSLKDENGRVALKGFYEGIELSGKEKTLLNDVPENLDSIKQRLGIARQDNVGETYQEALQYPSLNIRGLNAAWVGDEVRTIIPSEVITEIDMRLVPESDGEKLMQSLKQHIKDQGYHLVDSIPSEKERKTYPKLASFKYRLGSKPFRTDMDSQIGKYLEKAMQKVFGENYIKMRTTGGSQPIAPFIATLSIPAVSIRIPNPDNNIHSPNENLRIGNFLEGIITCLAILDEPIE
ncbi:M20/M25/M40 family metallo-hydrolase [Maribacter algarum]|uniref:M20/M25/M40 family metallo-hydrolase n=1 Tax=Maribacter algarum (ex Zhang et al. 2020) TaxID=2578118 RepID=A0A5S3PGM2_9FLAO|nr:M20/M25/M40 family metallo-hydrolase [Maribacter algarum]TMM53255.1 M20/M25/M40 family metallo-hydrolase [Maribacter algarum]